MKKSVLLLTLIAINVQLSLAQNSMWGLTYEGGGNNAGVIYKTEMDGTNQSIVFQSLYENDGYMPNELTGMAELPSTGEIYGVTEQGGTSNSGVLFKYNPTTSKYTKLVDFAGSNGKRPVGGLFVANNNKIYGTTKESDADGSFTNGTAGSIFEFDPSSNTLNTIHKFSDSDGKNPYSTLYQASDGKLYGTTSGGGANGKGVLFQYDITNNTFQIIHSFSVGKAPYGGVVELNNKLVGATSLGGSADKGIIYEFDLSTQTFAIKVHFSSAQSGYMNGAFVAVGDALYGVTNGNQQVTGSYGKLIKYIPGESSCSVLHSFVIFTSGIYPIGGLCKKGNVLMGTLEGGPLTPRGTVFEYDLDATSGNEFSYTALSSISQIDLKGTLVSSSNGVFGLTKSAGSTNNGSIYSYNFESSPKNTTDVISFKIDKSGRNPIGKVTRAANGMLYGNMQLGGSNRSGVLFSFDPNSNTYSVVYNFPKDSKPNGSMALVGNNRLYGMSETGGDFAQGYIFEYNTTSNEFNIIHHFDTTLTDHKTFNDANLGALPKAGFTVLNDSILYGTTSKGGFANDGMLFKLVASKHNAMSVQKLVSFDVLTGSEPAGDLEQNGDYLYGMTYNGGTLVPGGGQGTIYRYKIGGTYEPLVAFKGGENGEYPLGSMTLIEDKLYGFTHGKENNNDQLGVLLQYDPANKYAHTVLHEFIGSSDAILAQGGSKPYGKMTLSTNGKLYGTTSMGSGINTLGGDYGVIFEFDPTTSTYKSIETFTGPNGATPGVNSELVIVCATDATVSIDQPNQKLIANEANAASYQWYSVNVNSDQRILIDEATQREYAPEKTGTYSVEVEKNGCANYSDYYFIEISECDLNASVEFDAENEVYTAVTENADSYQWYSVNGSETSIITDATQRAFAPTESGSYQVEITVGNCTAISENVTFEKQVICNIDTTLSYDEDLLLITSNESGATYQWYKEDELTGTYTLLDNETQRVFTPTNSGTYLVEISTGECTDFSEKFEFVQNVECSTNASLSYDFSLNLFVANEATASAYQWYSVTGNPEVLTAIEGETNRTFSPTVSGNYKAEVTKNACSNFSETYVYEKDATCNTNASADYNTDLNIFIASEANASGYQWYELIDNSMVAITGEDGRAYTPNHTGDYLVEVTKNGCSNYSDPMHYEHLTVCTTDASASYNEGLKIFIANEPNAEKYQWFEVDEEGGLLIITNATHRTYTPLKTANYKLEVTKNGCSNFSDILEFDMNANCQTDASIIYKEELQLFIASEPEAFFYQWYEETAEGVVAIDGENNRSFSPSKTGYYLVEVSKNGCSNLSQSMYYEFVEECNTVAAIYYQESNQSLEATELNADAYLWLMDVGSGVFEPITEATERVYFPSQSGVYKVSVTKNGCEKLSDSMEFTYIVNCTLEASVSLDASGTQLVASETGATRYQWYEWLEDSKELILLENETGELYTPIKSGNYIVEITVDECSDFSSPVYFEFVDPCDFQPVASFNDETQTIVLDPMNNVQSYTWYMVDATTSEKVEIDAQKASSFTPDITGKYVAMVTLNNNCSQYSNEVYFEAPIVCNMQASISYNVKLHAFVADAPGATTYQWYQADNMNNANPREITNATAQTFAPTESGYYFVEASVNGNCIEISQTLAFEKPGDGACDLYATLILDNTLNMLVSNDMGDVTYEWFKVDEASNEMTLVATTTTRKYTPGATGIYVVKIIDEVCSATSNEIYFESSLAVGETTAVNQTHIYPNPASDILNITTDKKMKGFRILSLSGKEVYAGNAMANTVQLDISQLENGIYFVSILLEDDSIVTQKIIKRKSD